jgi:acyl-coenzyme A thioesterase PaaI-like protein
MDLLAFGKSVLESQQFSLLLGCTLNSFEPGNTKLELIIEDKHLQQHGFVLGDSVTSEFKINYTRPAIGDKLLAEASVVAAGKRQAVCDCKIYAVEAEAKKLVAVAQGTIVKA